MKNGELLGGGAPVKFFLNAYIVPMVYCRNFNFINIFKLIVSRNILLDLGWKKKANIQFPGELKVRGEKLSFAGMNQERRNQVFGEGPIFESFGGTKEENL